MEIRKVIHLFTKQDVTPSEEVSPPPKPARKAAPPKPLVLPSDDDMADMMAACNFLCNTSDPGEYAYWYGEVTKKLRSWPKP